MKAKGLRQKDRNAARGFGPSRRVEVEAQANALSYLVGPYAVSLHSFRPRPAFGSERALSKWTNGVRSSCN